jgi:thiamine pyrophosphokinase
VTLVNHDEAALVIKGPGGTRIDRVLGKLRLQAKGTYHITMQRQAPDDNHLVLKIK